MSLEHDHDADKKRYRRLLAKWRKKFFIPPRWTITLNVGCPEQLPDAQGFCAWQYLPNAHYRIVLRCGMENELADWVIAHELLEALTSAYAQFTENALESLPISSELLQKLQEQHGDVRNEIIEWFLCILFRHGRPVEWDGLSEHRMA